MIRKLGDFPQTPRSSAFTPLLCSKSFTPSLFISHILLIFHPSFIPVVVAPLLSRRGQTDVSIEVLVLAPVISECGLKDNNISPLFLIDECDEAVHSR